MSPISSLVNLEINVKYFLSGFELFSIVYKAKPCNKYVNFTQKVSDSDF